jgi:hypothetical protein
VERGPVQIRYRPNFRLLWPRPRRTVTVLAPSRCCLRVPAISEMKGWDEECDGRCVPLAVRVEAGVFSGAWEPTTAEQGMFSSRPAATWY